MREFNSDRPAVTESPYTMDAGHFQAEFGGVNVGLSRRAEDLTMFTGLSFRF
jgi:hypothetical protein